MNLTRTAEDILTKRYYQPGEDFASMLTRVAEAVADNKHDAKLFYEMMNSGDFLPNSPTLMNAGVKDGQLSACFVLPIEDSLDSIFDTIKWTAKIHQTGGGTGFNFSKIRPSGSPVRSTNGVASGPISFMQVFNSATDVIKQGGKRRGANMGVLRVDHPDIMEFIKCKSDTSVFTNFNISVAITEKFMSALDIGGGYDFTDGSKKSVRDVWKAIVDAAWATGEPGVIFIDRINDSHSIKDLGDIEATNPCGEQPLLPFEACNLGSINLSNFVKNNEVSWDTLNDCVRAAVRFLDRVISINTYPLPQIAELVGRTRKIGLGVMGWADMLFKLGMRYDSDEALNLAGILGSAIRTAANIESEELGAKFGYCVYLDGKENKRRNATLTTIAPTGTISIIANCSSGIEPAYALSFERRIMDNNVYTEYNPVYFEWLEKNGLLDGIPDYFITAQDVSPEWHVKMQAAWQKSTDNAVSKTVNMPNSATHKDVETVFLMAYELGCKGVTVYRDGSRSFQVLSEKVVVENTDEVRNNQELNFIVPRVRTKELYGKTVKIRTGCGNLYVTINSDDKGICEVFTTTGKKGGCQSQSEATARLSTIGLRCGIDPRNIADQLKGIRCPSSITNKKSECLSCPDALAKVILKESSLTAEETNGNSCPECDRFMTRTEGCNICTHCGWSNCG